MIMGKVSDIYARKVVVVKYLIQENRHTWHEMAKIAKISQAYVCKIDLWAPNVNIEII